MKHNKKYVRNEPAGNDKSYEHEELPFDPSYDLWNGDGVKYMVMRKVEIGPGVF
jgi:hypothetical protein